MSLGFIEFMAFALFIFLGGLGFGARQQASSDQAKVKKQQVIYVDDAAYKCALLK